ncbi:hypothetical protein LXL04_007491 [Taraxacum kok-saghyz]
MNRWKDAQTEPRWVVGRSVTIPTQTLMIQHNLSRNMKKSFENSYIPENPRTPKPLTFSKNRLRGAKNRSNISPVAKFFFRKNDFFFQKLCICANFLSLYNTYLKRFVKKNLKKNAKKKELHICTKNKKSCTYAKVKKKYRFFGNFFQRIVMIKNVLEGSEVGTFLNQGTNDSILAATDITIYVQKKRTAADQIEPTQPESSPPRSQRPARPDFPGLVPVPSTRPGHAPTHPRTLNATDAK